MSDDETSGPDDDTFNDGEPRVRRLRLAPDLAAPPEAGAGSDGAADGNPARPELVIVEAGPPTRDVDTLSEEDHRRGERLVANVVARREADRADGVVSLSRERLLRLRRRRGLPMPD